MKKSILFFASLAVVLFVTNAFAKRGRSSGGSDTVYGIYDGVDVLGPYEVEIDYSKKIGVLVRDKIYDSFYVSKEHEELITRKHSGMGKKNLKLFLVICKTRPVEKFSSEGRDLANRNLLHGPKEATVKADLEKRYPKLHPAGPYELFSLVIAHSLVMDLGRALIATGPDLNSDDFFASLLRRVFDPTGKETEYINVEVWPRYGDGKVALGAFVSHSRQRHTILSAQYGQAMVFLEKE